MNRRRRAILFGLGAAAAALLAITLINGYSTSVANTYGPLRPVVVLRRDLPAGRPVSPDAASNSLQVREVPELFSPAAALSGPDQALGLVPVTALPAGSYLSANLLRPAKQKKKRRSDLAAGRHPVELEVSGAGALADLSGARPRVDVLVSRESRSGAGGHTFVAASRVPLLEVGATGKSELGPGLTRVTLGLSRRQAVNLIQAQIFARRMTLLPLGNNG